MTNKINSPNTIAGLDSQPLEEGGAMLDIQQLSNGDETFPMSEIPSLRQIEGLDSGILTLAKLDRVLQHQARVRDIKPEVIDMTHLDQKNLDWVDQILGEGEVSMVYKEGDVNACVQESLMAGIWRIRYNNQQEGGVSDVIEVAQIPRLCRRHAFNSAAHRADTQHKTIPEGVLNAPPVLAEINDKVAEYRPGRENHVINLTLLPQTEHDLPFLMQRLGTGPLAILSRGYGNCKITSTAVQNVWWVQYSNSQNENNLNTLEVGDVPAVIVATHEDIRESAARLGEIMETCQ